MLKLDNTHLLRSAVGSGCATSLTQQAIIDATRPGSAHFEKWLLVKAQDSATLVARGIKHLGHAVGRADYGDVQAAVGAGVFKKWLDSRPRGDTHIAECQATDGEVMLPEPMEWVFHLAKLYTHEEAPRLGLAILLNLTSTLKMSEVVFAKRGLDLLIDRLASQDVAVQVTTRACRL